MVSEKGRKVKGKKSTISAVDGEDIAANEKGIKGVNLILQLR